MARVTFFETDAGDGIGFYTGTHKCTVNRFGETSVRHCLHHWGRQIAGVVQSNRSIGLDDLRCGCSYLVIRGDELLFAKCNDLNFFTVGFVGVGLDDAMGILQYFEIDWQELAGMLESGAIVEAVAAKA